MTKAANITLFTLLCLAALQPVQGAAKDEYTLYLTAKADSGDPANEPARRFSCSDKIYAVLEINRPGDTTRHTLFATWRNPSGEDQEFTKYSFQLINGRARIWVWLKLRRSAESSLVQFMNPSAGMEEFVGEWELRLRVDEQSIGKKKFEVIC